MGKGITRLIRQLNANDWISPLLDEVTASSRKESWRQPNPAIHPSGLASHCELQIQLTMLGHSPAVAGGTVRIFDTGTDAHVRWMARFKAAGMLIHEEYKVRIEKPLVNGSADVIIQHPATGERFVGELKTTNENSYKKLPKSGGDPKATMRLIYAVGGLYRKYCLQITAYMQATGLKGFFLFENKNTQEYRILFVEPDEAMIEETLGKSSKAVIAQDATIQGKLIPHPFDRTSFQCRNCDNRTFCDKLRDEEPEAVEFVQARLAQVQSAVAIE